MGRICTFVIIFSVCAVGHAHQPLTGRILATIGPYLHQTHALQTGHLAYTPFSAGAALLGEADTDSNGGLELGLMYLQKFYRRTSGHSPVVEAVNKIEIPMGYRYWPTTRFSLGLIFTAAYSIGESRIIDGSAASAEDATSAREIAEYGLVFSPQWEAWSGDKFAVVLDGRYFLSLSAKSGEDANQYALLVGVKYLIQK